MLVYSAYPSFTLNIVMDVTGRKQRRACGTCLTHLPMSLRHPAAVDRPRLQEHKDISNAHGPLCKQPSDWDGSPEEEAKAGSTGKRGLKKMLHAHVPALPFSVRKSTVSWTNQWLSAQWWTIMSKGDVLKGVSAREAMPQPSCEIMEGLNIHGVHGSGARHKRLN